MVIAGEALEESAPNESFLAFPFGVVAAGASGTKMGSAGLGCSVVGEVMGEGGAGVELEDPHTALSESASLGVPFGVFSLPLPFLLSFTTSSTTASGV